MFVVYHIASTMEVKTYKHWQHAERLTNEKNRTSRGQFAYTTEEIYRNNVVHMVERTNLQSGKKYMEPSNTPNYCSPASEAYWSM